MALTYNSLQRNLYTCQGRYHTLSFNVASDAPLTGQVIRINPAPFMSSVPSIGASNHSFQIVYPASGTVPMTYIGQDVNENFEMNLTVIDATSFTVEYKFFILPSLGAFLNDSSYNNGTILASSFVNGGYLVFEVRNEGNGDSITFGTETYSTGFNSALSIDATGFDPNSDLDITITSTDQQISNTWYAGWVDVSNITNIDFMLDDLSLNYAQINSGGVTAVDTLPMAVFNDGTGFTWDGSENKATLQILSNDLNAGSEYRLYVVYKDDGLWRSYISPSLNQIAPDRAQIIPNLTPTFTDSFGTEHGSGCVYAVANCGNSLVCVDIEKDDFDFQMAALGYTETWDDVFQSAFIFRSQSNPVNGNLGTNLGTPNFVTNTTAKLKLCYTEIDTDLSGVYYYTIQVNTLVAGVTDTMNIVYEIGYSSTTEVDPVITTVSSGNESDRICIQDTYTTDQDFTDCVVAATINGGVTSGVVDSATGVVDPSGLEEGDVVCVTLCCNGTPTNSDCVCPECEDRTFTVQSIPGNTLEFFQITVTQTDGNQDDLELDVFHNSGTSTFTGTGSIDTGSLMCGNGAGNPCGFSYTLRILSSSDGCEYGENGSTVVFFDLQDVDINQMTLTPTTSYQDCDCNEVDPDPLVCDNRVWFDITCDPTTGDITAVANQTTTSPILTDDISSPLTGNGELTVTRTMTFSDGCPSITVTEVIDCQIEEDCENTLIVDYTNVSGLVTLTETANLVSPILSDTGLQYSLDNGLTFIDYTVPVQLTDGQTIVWSRTIIFDDGCPDITVGGSTSFDDETVSGECTEDYSSYSLTATFSEIDETWTVVKTGDETPLTINELEWNALGLNPFDENNSGVPYLAPVNHYGPFTVAWRIKVPNCPEHILYAQGFSCKDQEVIINNDDCDPIPVILCEPTPGEDTKVQLPE